MGQAEINQEGTWKQIQRESVKLERCNECMEEYGRG